MMDLEQAWEAVGRIEGPALGDTKAPLAERCEAFSERIAAFRAVLG